MDLETKVTSYKMNEVAQQVVRDTRLLLIASVTGGGKDTIINRILKDGGYHLIVSHTTRRPRENHGIPEQDGIDYHFISLGKAGSMIQESEFIEVKYNHGNIYGTSVSEVKQALDNNMTAIADMDIKGIVEYLTIKPETHAIFLLPPSVETWLSRLENRFGNLEDQADEINTRLNTARDELNYIIQDRRFVCVVNDDLDTTVRRIKGIVDGSVDHSSDYALTIAEHLLDYLERRLSTLDL